MLRELWRTRRPSVADLLVAAGFVVLGQLVTWLRWDDTWAFAGPRGVNAVLNLLMMAALAWRRTMPVAAVAWAVVVYYVPYAVAPHDLTLLAAFVPLIVLTASAGYYAPWRRALLALGLAFAAITIAMLTTPWLRGVDQFIYNGTVLAVAWLMGRGLREREQRAARLATQLVAERAAGEAAVREVVAEERARIARELHDIVAHSVSVMVVQIGAARMQLHTGAASPEKPLLDAEDVGRQALGDLRRMLGILRAQDVRDLGEAPQTPQPGLVEIDGLAAKVGAAGLPVEVYVDGAPRALPAMLDLTAYRVVQESLTNALKHSGADRATVRVTYRQSVLRIEVADDGRRAAAPGLPGHGLVGMRERVALFGGTVIAGPAEDGGWRVAAELPVPAPAAGEALRPDEDADVAVPSA